MAKKKKGLAALKSKAKAVKEIVSSKSNPPPVTDMVEFIAPGFVGYAGTRFVSRAIHSVVIKRWPKLAKHASVLSTFGAAGLLYMLVHRVKKIEKYHTPVVVGAGIAAIQTMTQAYLPKYGWLVSDHNLNALPAQSPASTSLVAPKATAGLDNLPPPLFAVELPKKAGKPSDSPPEDLSELLGDDGDFGSLSPADALNGDELSDEDISDLLN